MSSIFNIAAAESDFILKAESLYVTLLPLQAFSVFSISFLFRNFTALCFMHLFSLFFSYLIFSLRNFIFLVLNHFLVLFPQKFFFLCFICSLCGTSMRGRLDFLNWPSVFLIISFLFSIFLIFLFKNKNLSLFLFSRRLAWIYLQALLVNF